MNCVDDNDHASLRRDPSACSLVAGDLEAVFLPLQGMLGASLRHRGVELLRARGQPADCRREREHGGNSAAPSVGQPPRGCSLSRGRAGGDTRSIVASASPRRQGAADSRSAVVPAHLESDRGKGGKPVGRLDWTSDDLLAVFPFNHHVEMTATLSPDGLNLETTLVAGPAGPVPVSFGFHPYFGFPELPREKWRLELPAMKQLVLDGRGIPTGEEKPFAPFHGLLGGHQFDDGFAVLDEHASFSVAGAGRRITVDLLAGYRYAQVFAPAGKSFVALEPMTAPTNALLSGQDPQLVEAGGRFRAAFRIGVAVLP